MSDKPDWSKLKSVVSIMYDIVASAKMRPDEEKSRSFLHSTYNKTAELAAYLQENFDVNVYDERQLYDYLVGFSCGTSISYKTHEHFDGDTKDIVFVGTALTNCLPLLPLIPYLEEVPSGS